MMAGIVPFPRMAAMQAEMPEAPAQAPDDWGLWMGCAQAGDRDAYRRLLTAITPYLRVIARRHFAQREDVDDAVQEILVVVHEIRHTYEPGRPFRPWLSTIATRRCIDLLRRRATRRGVEATDDAAIDDAAGASPGPHEHAEQDSAAARMRRAVQALPAGQRRAIELVHLQDRSLAEAAAVSGQTAGALKVACHRAIRALRRALATGEET